MRLFHFILLTALVTPMVSIAAEDTAEQKKKARWVTSNPAPQQAAAAAPTPATPATPAPKASTNKKPAVEEDPSCD